jgi:hypothetical protein
MQEANAEPPIVYGESSGSETSVKVEASRKKLA